MMTKVRAMTAHLPDFWQGLTTNTWPSSFFRVSMGLSAEWEGKLPAIARGWLLAYFIAAAVCLILRYGKKQRPLSNLRQKLTDVFLTFFLPLLGRVIVVVFQIGQELAGKVDGGFAWSLAGMEWLGSVITAWFFPMGICLIFAVIFFMPGAAVLRYWRKYRFWAVPWSIYDVGLGLTVLASAILAMDSGNIAWYFASGAALALVLAGQIGGAETK